MKVFVYGTLKRGHRNNGVLENATFIGNGITLSNCRLLHAGFPVLMDEGGKPEDSAPVVGEVYECDEATVKRLDRLESEGRMYNRLTAAIVMENGNQLVCNLYVGNPEYWESDDQPLYETSEGLYIWPAATRPMRVA